MMAVSAFPEARMALSAGRSEVLTEARSWLGTPYRHQASLKGEGCDCLGLLRGIWRHFHGAEPEIVPNYTSDWAEVAGSETLLAAGRKWLVELPVLQALPGDVLVFRWREGCLAKHIGILGSGQTGPVGRASVIHAYERVGVVESPLVPAWRQRIAAAFSFPEIT